MQEVLKHLIMLQDLDSQLDRLESLRGDLPQQVQRLRRELNEKKQGLEDIEQKLTAYKKQQDIAEMEIKALEGKEKKYQNQLFQVKNNREYDAVTFEIEAVKADIAKKEGNVLELMDLEEETKKTFEDSKDEIADLQSRFDQLNKELGKQMARTEKDEAALRDKREKLLRHIKPRILGTDERIRAAKSGLAVVPVSRNACGGCFKSLPPQKILEIREMSRIYLCEVCGRVLVWDEVESEKPS